MKLEGVCVKYPDYSVRLGSTGSYINIYDKEGHYVGDVKIEATGDVILVTVFHPDEDGPDYSTHRLIMKEQGPEEFQSQRHEKFTFYDFDWSKV